MDPLINTKYVVNALLFSFIGLIMFAISFEVFDKLTPGNIWKEIFQEHNVAVAITVGAMTLAIAQIIGAAIHA